MSQFQASLLKKASVSKTDLLENLKGFLMELDPDVADQVESQSYMSCVFYPKVRQLTIQNMTEKDRDIKLSSPFDANEMVQKAARAFKVSVEGLCPETSILDWDNGLDGEQAFIGSILDQHGELAFDVYDNSDDTHYISFYGAINSFYVMVGCGIRNQEEVIDWLIANGGTSIQGAGFTVKISFE